MKSRKNQNVNLATISAEAVGFLSAYNVADYEMIALKKDHDKKVKDLETRRDEILKDMKDKEYTITPVQKAEYEKQLTDISLKIMAKDKEYKEAQKPFRKAMNKALDFVPENIYDHYLKAWETGRDINFACAIRQFLKAVGIAVRTDGEIDNFTQTMKIRCSGSRNNSMKNREQDGNRLAAKSGRQFDNTFMKAFLDYAINGKKVLVEDENHVITKRVFE